MENEVWKAQLWSSLPGNILEVTVEQRLNGCEGELERLVGSQNRAEEIRRRNRRPEQDKNIRENSAG
jgi:hypothetical protein